MLLNTPAGYVSPELWDNGVPALMSSYTLSATSSRYRPTRDNATYLYSNLHNTLALGAWRFTTYDSLSSGSDTENTGVQHIQAYAERAIAPLQSQIVLGDMNTTGDFLTPLPCAAFVSPRTIACFPTPYATMLRWCAASPTAMPR